MGLLDAWRRRRERRAQEKAEKRARKEALRSERAAARAAPRAPVPPPAAPGARRGRREDERGRTAPAPEEQPAPVAPPAEAADLEDLSPAQVPREAADEALAGPDAADDTADGTAPADVARRVSGPLVPPEPQLESLDPAVKAERRRRARGARPRRAAEPAPLAPDAALDLLRSLATAHLPPDAAAALLALARPALRLHADAPSDPRDAGSRLGGLPVLPPQAAWPEHRGRPLHFVAQIRLEEAAAEDVELALPRLGLLSFFHLPDEDVWGYDPRDRGAWAVLRFDASAAVPREAPEDVEVYEARRLRTLGTWSVPDRFAQALAPVRALTGDDDALDAVLGAYADSTGRVRHQLLGWPAEGEDPMARAASAASAGLYAGTGRLDDARLAAAGADPARWRLLLQLDSDDDAGMVWGDDCRLCFWLPEDALRAGRFADTWMLVRCG